MNIRQLQYFRELAKTEHYTKTAKKLDITQPSLSHAISELEKDLGVALFEKEGRNVRLTKYGRFFLTYVEDALTELEKGRRKLMELINPTTGNIDLGYVGALGLHFISKIIGAYHMQIHDKKERVVNFSFIQSNEKDLMNKLIKGQYEFVFNFKDNEYEQCDYLPVAQYRFVLIVSPDHELAGQDTITLEKLKEYPLLCFSPQSTFYSIVHRFLDKHNIVPLEQTKLGNMLTITGLVEQNYGIAIVPHIRTLEYSDVKIIELDFHQSDNFIYMATLKTHELSPVAQSFKTFIEEQASKGHLDNLL